jgi:hypothetical protein
LYVFNRLCAFLLAKLNSRDPGGHNAFRGQASGLEGKKIGGADDVIAALAIPFQLMQTGDVGGVFGGTTGHGPDVCPVAVVEKMFAGHGDSLQMRLW